MSIVDELRPDITPCEGSFRHDTISTEKKLAMCLYYLKDQGSFRMTANTFGVSPSTGWPLIREIREIRENQGIESVREKSGKNQGILEICLKIRELFIFVLPV